MEILCRDNLSSVRNQVNVLQKQKELEWRSTCVGYCFCWQRLYLILSHELKRDNVCNVDAGPGQPQLTETKLVQPPVNLSPGKKLKGNGVNKGPGGRFNKFLLKMHEIMLLMENIFVCYVKLIVCRCTFVFWRNCYAGVTDSINSLSLQSRPIKMRIFYQNESCRISAILLI